MLLGYSFPFPYSGFAGWAMAMMQSETYVDDFFFVMTGRCLNALVVVVVSFSEDRSDVVFPAIPSRLGPNPQ